MKHETIEYFDNQDKLIGELIYDDQVKEKRSAIIVFHAFEGRADFALEYAEKLAQRGFVVLAADMYGNAQLGTTIDECFALISPFLQDRALVRRRALLAYQTLARQEVVDASKISAIGFCFGGMCVLELARSGENLSAGVSVHGALAKSELPTYAIKGKILVLHGYQDPQVPPSLLEPFAQEMEQAGVQDWTVTFFGTAKHSFSDPRTGTFDENKEKAMGREYHPWAATRSFQQALAFFQE